jgi:hypothetical protein
VYEDWTTNIPLRMPSMRLRLECRDFDTGHGVARRMASYELTIDGYLYYINVYEIEYELEFEYFGIEPDETAEHDLLQEYERMVILRTLKGQALDAEA